MPVNSYSGGIMKTFNQFLNEMAMNIGNPYSLLHSNPKFSSQNFNNTSEHPIVKELSPGIKLHMHIDDNRTEFNVNDHNTKQSLYRSVIYRNEKNSDIPFDNIEQAQVDRVKSTNVLPKNFATDFIYNHWKTQSLPLRSSDQQFTTGRDMWSRLIDKAHLDNKHVFYIDENKNKHRVTRENKEDMMRKYFGIYDVHLNRHMVLSHSEHLN